MRYPEFAQELSDLLDEDQNQYKSFVRDKHASDDKTAFNIQADELHQAFKRRAARALVILDQIGEPSISAIGVEAATALSVLASHDSYVSVKRVLDAFTACYARDPNDTHYQSIPPMTDWMALIERRPQTFGTIWLLDKQGWPFLPTIKDFQTVNDRRANYGIEPLRWPKSLAIPETDQPWLSRPFEEFVMRELTEEEYTDTVKDFF